MTATGIPSPGDRRLVLIKLGGSILTRKSTLGGIRYDNMKRLAREIAEIAKDHRVIVVHGGGSFGHPLARLYHIYGRGGKTTPPSDLQWRSEGASAIQRSMLRLNAALIGALVDAGIPALSVPGGILVELYDGELEAFHPGSIERYLAAGLTPVTFGDVAPDRHRGLAIVSGDTLVLALAETVHPDLVIFATDQDGIYDRDPGQHRDAALTDDVDSVALRGLAASLAEATGERIDATGGMILKIQELADIADLGIAAAVVSGLEPGRIQAVVNGDETVATRIRPSPRRSHHHA
jgi:isopentenyl phosphate kinase